MSTVAARVWPWVPVGLLGSMLAGLFAMAAIAVRDPGFALERDYYKKAVAFDREIAQRVENERLGWTVRVDAGAAAPRSDTTLVVELRDATGPITGARVNVEALRNAAAANGLEALLTERRPGEYEARLPLRRGGLWEIRISASRGADRFTRVERRDVAEAAP